MKHGSFTCSGLEVVQSIPHTGFRWLIVWQAFTVMAHSLRRTAALLAFTHVFTRGSAIITKFYRHFLP